MTFLVCHNSIPLKLSEYNVCDLDLCELLTVTVALLEALAADLLEYEDLVSPDVISEYGSLNASALNIRSTYLNITLIFYEEDLGELHSSTFCIRKTVAEDLVASFHFELLAGNFYDCVHYKNSFQVFDCKRIPSGYLLASLTAIIYRTAKILFFSFVTKSFSKFVNIFVTLMETTFTYDKTVTGRNFIGRKAECAQLRDIISRGLNVSIYEPAKTGKNSLICQTLFEMKASGLSFRTAEFSLLNIRSMADYCIRLISTVVGVFASTPDEHRAIVQEYLGGTSFSYDGQSFAHGGAVVSLTDDLKADDLRAALNLPYRLAEKTGTKLLLIVHEFQNILLTEGPDTILNIYEEVVRKAGPRQRELCSWIWVGSRVNAMKTIFEQKRYFYRMVQRVKLEPISYREIENHVIKGFLVSGKVIDNEFVEKICAILQNNIYYVNHFAAICDGLSRGYIMAPVVDESLQTMLAIHQPRFVAAMNELTTFQLFLLRAILDGESMFSSADVIARYKLNSSANVRRLKDALCKKEIITFTEDDKAVILDPLFEYWMRKYYFNI